DGFLRSLGCQASHGWKYKYFETSFLYFVRDINLNELFHENELSDLNNRLMALEGELRDRKAARERLFDLFLAPGEQSDAFIKGKYDALNTTIEALQKEHQAITDEIDSIVISKSDIDDLVPMIESLQTSNADAYEKRIRIASMLSSIITKIHLYRRCFFVSFKNRTDMQFVEPDSSDPTKHRDVSNYSGDDLRKLISED